MSRLDPAHLDPTNAPFGPRKPICLDFGPAFLFTPFLLTLQHMYSCYYIDKVVIIVTQAKWFLYLALLNQCGI